MAPALHRTRVRPSPSTTKSPRRRVYAAGFDSDNDEAPARYHVSVRSAKNLKREGFRGLTNPYCQLNVGRQGPYTTEVAYDTANPSWEHKRQTFEFKEGSGPEEDKLTLACFNAGDVPELIGRLSVALSHATHKVISLPMFRKDLGGSQVWAGSVEIELHYIPAGEGGFPFDRNLGGRVLLGDAACDQSSGGRSTGGGGGGGSSSGSHPPLSPCSTSLASSFMKAAARSLPEDQVDLLALSPRTAKGAEAAASRRYGGRAGGDGSSEKDACGLVGEATAAAVAASGDTSGGGSAGGGDARRGGNWKSFFAGALCSALLVLGVLLGLGDSLLASGQPRLGITVMEDGGAGRQAVVTIHGPTNSWLADRHLVVFVGGQEVCRGGVPAPTPPTEGSTWAQELWSSEDGASAGGGKGGSGCERILELSSRGDCDSGDEATDCGQWCTFVRWQAGFLRRLAEPLYAARRSGPRLK